MTVTKTADVKVSNTKQIASNANKLIENRSDLPGTITDHSPERLAHEAGMLQHDIGSAETSYILVCCRPNLFLHPGIVII